MDYLENCMRGTAKCVTDFFYHIVVSITVQNHDNLESLCVTEKKATFVFGCKEDYVKREIVLTPSTSN